MFAHPGYEDVTPFDFTYYWVPTKSEQDTLNDIFHLIDYGSKRFEDGFCMTTLFQIGEIIGKRRRPFCYVLKQRANDYMREIYRNA